MKISLFIIIAIYILTSAWDIIKMSYIGLLCKRFLLRFLRSETVCFAVTAANSDETRMLI